MFRCVCICVGVKTNINKQKNDKDKIQINVYMEKKAEGWEGKTHRQIHSIGHVAKNSWAACGQMDVHYIIHKWINNMTLRACTYQRWQYVMHQGL